MLDFSISRFLLIEFVFTGFSFSVEPLLGRALGTCCARYRPAAGRTRTDGATFTTPRCHQRAKEPLGDASNGDDAPPLSRQHRLQPPPSCRGSAAPAAPTASHPGRAARSGQLIRGRRAAGDSRRDDDVARRPARRGSSAGRRCRTSLLELGLRPLPQEPALLDGPRARLQLGVASHCHTQSFSRASAAFFSVPIPQVIALDSSASCTCCIIFQHLFHRW